uniref:Peptidase A1 domain-containing protein n=1 Tax=Oryza barthii TaxID=65489 RepID=A0A0D3GQ85_9ORYZ
MKPENAFVTVQEGTLCLAIEVTTKQQPVSILGNLAQQNIHVGYDLDAGTVTFAGADCAGSS